MKYLSAVLALLFLLSPLAVSAEDGTVTVGIDNEDVVLWGGGKKKTTG